MMEFHDVANLFRLMTEEEYAPFRDDIREHGQREPIWTYDGKIIDGRNRYRACIEIGIEPITRVWNGDGSLVAFVVSLNLKRRQLNQSQAAVVALDIEIELGKEGSERQRAAAIETNRQKRAIDPRWASVPGYKEHVERTARHQEQLQADRQLYFIRDGNRVKIGISTSPYDRLQQLKTGSPHAILIGAIPTIPGLEPELHRELAPWAVGHEWFTWCDEVTAVIDRFIAIPTNGKSDKAPIRAARDAAKLVGVSHGYVSAAKKLAVTHPDLLERIRAGKISIPEAEREIRDQKREATRESNRALVADTAPPAPPAPDQRYQTIVIDPPWDWGDEGDTERAY